MPTEVTDPSVLAQLNAPDQPSAPPSDEPQEVTDPKLLAQLNAPEHDPTDGMSNFDKFAAGAGKSVVDTGRGLYQLGASLGHAMGVVSDEKMQQIQKDADDQDKQDAPLLRTGAGMAGNIAGGALQAAALPEMFPEKLAASPLLSAATSGAAYSAVQPTTTGDDRMENAAWGAIGGAGGEAAGRALGFLAQPLKSALTTAGKHAVDTLTKAGIPLDLAQQTGSRIAVTLKNFLADNPLLGPSAFPEEQGHAFNRAVLKTMGINDPAVTVADSATLDQGRQAIKNVMNRVAQRNPIQYDTKLNSDLARIWSDAPSTLTNDDIGPVRANLQNLIRSAANNNGYIPGAVYQRLRSNLAQLSKNPKYGTVMYNIQQALDDAMQRSASPADQQAWKTARQQYRAMMQIRGAVDPATGDISPAKLLSRINRESNYNQSLFGKGDQSLVDLAKAAKPVLAPHNPNSGTARRLAGMAGVGAIVGGGDELLHGNPVEALKLGAMGAAAPWAARQLIENPTLVKGITKWNNSPIIKGATDTVRKGLATGIPAAQNAERQLGAAKPSAAPPPEPEPEPNFGTLPDDAIQRATGGRVDDIEPLVNRLMDRWKAAKKATDETTKPLLQIPDATIIKALNIAGRSI